MFTGFFFELKKAKVPVTLREYLTLLEAMEKGLAEYDVEQFYYLSRATLVKDERNLDKFDQVFSHVFKGLEAVSGVDGVSTAEIPEEWLRKMSELFLSEEERQMIESLGGFEKLMETLKKRLEEQKGRHQGGNKWIGTGGTSPFGAYGFNPEGVRIGQHESRHRKAVKVWDRRDFKNFDDSVELGTRNIKVALKRLRQWVRQGADEELDLPNTITSTAHNAGYLDIKMRPERHNKVKVLLFLDVGGSMDDHIKICEELFSAARTELKNLEHFYFHNCLYESVWKDNRRRHAERLNTFDIIHKFGPDYKVIFVGDATMSPYEVIYPGGSVEHWNEEAGHVWLSRVLETWPKAVWLNPVNERYWSYTQSLNVIKDLFKQRMFPLTLAGLDQAMKELGR